MRELWPFRGLRGNSPLLNFMGLEGSSVVDTVYRYCVYDEEKGLETFFFFGRGSNIFFIIILIRCSQVEENLRKKKFLLYFVFALKFWFNGVTRFNRLETSSQMAL